jgi:tetratricopeptide (TPR) repeat protein
MKLISAFFLICIFLCESSFLNIRAQNCGTSVFSLADSLFSSANYFESAIANERIYFDSDDTEQKIKANLKRADALIHLKEYARARNDLQRSIHMKAFPDLHFKVIYKSAFCGYMEGKYAEVISLMMQAKILYPEEVGADFVLLQTLSYVMNGNWDLALTGTHNLIRLKSWTPQQEEEFMTKTVQLFDDKKFPVKKSSTKASLLSTFIPGAGHIYAGYTGKGLLNSASQVVALGLAGFLVYNQMYITGFVVGLGMFQSFYFGGIKQAVDLTEQRNLIQYALYKDELKQFIIHIYESE